MNYFGSFLKAKNCQKTYSKKSFGKCTRSSSFPLRRLKSYETFTVSRKLLNCCRLRSLCNFSFLMYASASITSGKSFCIRFTERWIFRKEERDAYLSIISRGKKILNRLLTKKKRPVTLAQFFTRPFSWYTRRIFADVNHFA